jgi:sn-glycerol 3-phosphate transport system permease protein
LLPTASGPTAVADVLAVESVAGLRPRAADDSIPGPLKGWLLVLPAAVFLVGFTYLPAARNLLQSVLSAPRPGAAAHWVGLENYQDMLDDPLFWKVLSNNAWYALGTIPVSMALALGMALYVQHTPFGRAMLRFAYFTPTILPMIAVANIWLFIYTPGYGLLDQVLGLFGLPAHNWLGSSDIALPCVVAVAVWKEAGFFMIFYLAALQQISPRLGEAAALEGSGRWYFFRRITLPLLMPTSVFILINATVNSFRLVDHIVVLTHGGPNNATNILLYFIYQIGFQMWDSAYAATLTVVLLGLLASISLGQFFFFERRIHYR